MGLSNELHRRLTQRILALPDANVTGYYVDEDGHTQERGSSRAIARWHEREAAKPDFNGPWALAAIASVYAKVTDAL